ncbi:MAG: CIA30 family protein [Bacteroidales bacterium]|nr:CIA30 family protein [Bacteroidales bacterium]
MNSFTIIEFSKNSDISNWNIVDDIVMGGKSSSEFELSEKGSGIFKGSVSLENNGGFSSVQHRFKNIDSNAFLKFVIHIKGDGKRYQFRIKANANDYYSYIFNFPTTGDWQIVEIPFGKMSPSFRGTILNQSNFSGEKIQEIGFLIGNKKAEDFKLEIKKIELL